MIVGRYKKIKFQEASEWKHEIMVTGVKVDKQNIIIVYNKVKIKEVLEK